MSKKLIIGIPETMDQSQNQNQSQNEELSKASLATTEHLDAIPLPENEPAPLTGEGVVAETSPAALSKEAFFTFGTSTFRGMSAATGLKSLHIEEGRAGAREAFDALYDEAKDNPYLNWLLSPDSPRVQRIVAMLAFFGPMSLGVYGEIRARRKKPAPANGEIKPAPVVNHGGMVYANEI